MVDPGRRGIPERLLVLEEERIERWERGVGCLRPPKERDREKERERVTHSLSNTHTHTHTHTPFLGVCPPLSSLTSEVDAESRRDTPPVLIPVRDADLGTGIPEPAAAGERLGV